MSFQGHESLCCPGRPGPESLQVYRLCPRVPLCRDQSVDHRITVQLMFDELCTYLCLQRSLHSSLRETVYDPQLQLQTLIRGVPAELLLMMTGAADVLAGLLFQKDPFQTATNIKV